MVRATINPSRRLAVLLVVVHVGSAMVVIPLDMALWLKITLALGIAASLAHALYRHAFPWARSAVTAIEIKDRGSATVQTRDGRWREADILGTTYVSPLLTVLNIRIKGITAPRHVVIMPDTTDSGDFRKLRVALRWGYRERAAGR